MLVSLEFSFIVVFLLLKSCISINIWIHSKIIFFDILLFLILLILI